MLAVDLFDTLEVRAAPAAITLVQTRPGLSTGPDNLVVRAAEACPRGAAGTRGRNPPQLGPHPDQRPGWGRSSDAALALLALNRVWKLSADNAGTRRYCGVHRVGHGVLPGVPRRLVRRAGRAGDAGTGRAAARLRSGVPAGRTGDGRRVPLAVPQAPGAGTWCERRSGRATPPLGKALFNRLEEPAFALSPLVAGSATACSGSPRAGR